MSITEKEAYNELAFYTLSHQGKEFIHQHLVDAFTAQMANETTKPIALFFALAGLYLQLEKNYSGKQVQQAHMLFAQKPKSFPTITLPAQTGTISIFEVLKISPGDKRDAKIKDWCRSVWTAYRDEHHTIIAYTENLLKS